MPVLINSPVTAAMVFTFICLSPLLQVWLNIHILTADFSLVDLMTRWTFKRLGLLQRPIVVKSAISKRITTSLSIRIQICGRNRYGDTIRHLFTMVPLIAFHHRVINEVTTRNPTTCTLDTGQGLFIHACRPSVSITPNRSRICSSLVRRPGSQWYPLAAHSPGSVWQ